MNCIDCTEPITESERRGTVTCQGCKRDLHGECAMTSDDTGEAFCESCLHRDTRSFKQRMTTPPKPSPDGAAA